MEGPPTRNSWGQQYRLVGNCAISSEMDGLKSVQIATPRGQVRQISSATNKTLNSRQAEIAEHPTVLPTRSEKATRAWWRSARGSLLQCPRLQSRNSKTPQSLQRVNRHEFPTSWSSVPPPTVAVEAVGRAALPSCQATRKAATRHQARPRQLLQATTATPVESRLSLSRRL